MSEEIIINESFDEEEDLSFDDFNDEEFEDSEILNSKEILDLKLEANKIAQDSEITDLICYNEVSKNLEYKLPYQPEGALRILREFNGNALLADEVGLGKTITTGFVLKECLERGFVKKALILTPPSLVDQWVAELKEKFNLDFTIIEDEKTWDSTDLAIASIDRVKQYSRELGEFRHKKAHQIPWDILIVDEGHKLKDRRTTRWKFVDRIQKKRFLVLTATPFQNDLIELYNLLHLIKRGHLGTILEFRKQFLDRGNKRYPLNPKELKRKLDEVMVRRKRSETGIKYMKRIPKIISVELTPEEEEIYYGMCDMIKNKYFLANGTEINGKLVKFALLPKITSSSRSAIETLTKIEGNEKYHPDTQEAARQLLEAYKNLKKDSKIEELVKIVTKIYKENPKQKLLIYTKHPTTLKYIVEKLKPLNLKILEFIGGLDREQKTEIIKQFKADADILISTETGCEGLNFQFCNILINYDLPWNPMSVEQRIGRVDRIGQKKDMYIYSLATKNTMEEHVVDLIINKMCCIGLVIGELPIILFNLGLDGKGKYGANKIEEMLMNKFLDSKDNLEVFSKEVEEIAEIINKGIEAYKETKSYSTKMLK